jgi:hypothetical protein
MPRGQASAQDVVHLLELELGRRGLVDDIAVALELCVHALEVEAGGQFAVGLVDGVGQLVGVDFGHDVEGRHGRLRRFQWRSFYREGPHARPCRAEPTLGGFVKSSRAWARLYKATTGR